MFVKNTKPAEKDVELGPKTKAGFRMAHNASVRTVNVTKSTVGMINDVSPLPLNSYVVALTSRLCPMLPKRHMQQQLNLELKPTRTHLGISLPLHNRQSHHRVRMQVPLLHLINLENLDSLDHHLPTKSLLLLQPAQSDHPHLSPLGVLRRSRFPMKRLQSIPAVLLQRLHPLRQHLPPRRSDPC
jgi:hypothetical protein